MWRQRSSGYRFAALAKKKEDDKYFKERRERLAFEEAKAHRGEGAFAIAAVTKGDADVRNATRTRKRALFLGRSKAGGRVEVADL